MPVSESVRRIQVEIDESIRSMPIWQTSRVIMLERVMGLYRDSIELVFLEFMSAKALDLLAEELGSHFAKEDLIRSGILWSLKWALEFCSENGARDATNARGLVELSFLGSTYEALVDALKCAKWDLASIEVEEDTKTITCYEGAEITGYDAHIVEQSRVTAPGIPHVSLTEDSDQITSRWTAGDYRRVTKTLAAYAAGQEKSLVVNAPFLAHIGRPEISSPQPAVIWLDRPKLESDSLVFDDLVLPTDMNSSIKWKLVSLLDTPIIKIGDRYCALSPDLKAISVHDDYMLRLAARTDQQQYNRVSGLREGRMIRICEQLLTGASNAWTVRHRVLFSNPMEEADIIATRDSDSMVIQLKSTLRPQTPWEVFKRNQDLIDGIEQTMSLIRRGVARRGFVVTDGYRGDFSCWSLALAYNIPIATIYDLPLIAEDPEAAVTEVKKRVGIAADNQPKALQDREGLLLDWKLRVLDAEFLQQTSP